ncbi:hypothetical protein D7241_10100 [Stutzerimonas sp. VN223-3]|uniref:hypothetical protein n=1 Tax=Stutzerimonas sp. VN223-3 TaxID=3384601 RepID=UPI0038B5D449
MNSTKTPASSRRTYNVLLTALSLLFPSTTPYAAETLSRFGGGGTRRRFISALIDPHDAR